MIAGVDSFRGPYQEEVSTIEVSCHGCRYESKYEVLPEASVLLQLGTKTPNAKPLSTRGRVKWTKRPESGGLFQTAIELEQPGNIWGIDAPPSDWLPFIASRPVESDTTKPKQVVAVFRPTQADPHPGATPVSTDPRVKTATVPPATSAPRPAAPQVGQLMGGFQQQMENMLSQAAEAVLRERSAALLGEMRAQLRQEARQILAETSSAQVERWNENARTVHGQWSKKIEGEMQQAMARVDRRHRELEELSERLTAKTHDRLESFIESSRKEAVDKIISRLKEQSTPVIDSARKAASDLAKQEHGFEKVCQDLSEKAAVQIEDTCTRLDRQFEMILRERIDNARENLERAAAEVAKELVGKMHASSQQEQDAAHAALQKEFAKMTHSVLADLNEKAKELSRHFGGELSNHSRNHLEFVSGAISELAKGIGKLSKD